jgi:hypothetical protein
MVEFSQHSVEERLDDSATDQCSGSKAHTHSSTGRRPAGVLF